MLTRQSHQDSELVCSLRKYVEFLTFASFHLFIILMVTSPRWMDRLIDRCTVHPNRPSKGGGSKSQTNASNKRRNITQKTETPHLVTPARRKQQRPKLIRPCHCTCFTQVTQKFLRLQVPQSLHVPCIYFQWVRTAKQLVRNTCRSLREQGLHDTVLCQKLTVDFFTMQH